MNRIDAEELLNALAHDHFRTLRNDGNQWAIAHLSFDGVSIAEISDSHLDRLLATWVDIVFAIDHGSGATAEAEGEGG